MSPQADPDTEELLRRVQTGDSSASQSLLARYRQRLRQMIAVRMDSRLAARVDPSDVVQETLIEASGRLKRFAQERPLPFYPWLRQLAWERLERLHRRHIRAKKRSVTREAAPHLMLSDQSVQRFTKQLLTNGTSPSRRLLRAELRERVRAALEQLRPVDREVLMMRYLEQLNSTEVAAILGISVGAVHMRQLRALERLRALLGEDWQEHTS